MNPSDALNPRIAKLIEVFYKTNKFIKIVEILEVESKPTILSV